MQIVWESFEAVTIRYAADPLRHSASSCDNCCYKAGTNMREIVGILKLVASAMHMLSADRGHCKMLHTMLRSHIQVTKPRFCCC